jgi:hypothetical protein
MTPRPEIRSLMERLNAIEKRVEHARQNQLLPGAVNQKVLEALVAVVDSRLQEQATQFEERLRTETTALRSEFNERFAAARRHAAEESELLRSQLAQLHREFAESLALTVDEQINAAVDARVGPAEAKLLGEIRDQVGRAAGLFASATDELLRDRLEPLETEVAELGKRLGENDRNTLDLILALGQVCLQTAERLSPQAAPAPAVEPAPAPEAQPPAPAVEANGSKLLWRVGMVSSVLVTVGSLFLHHF